MAAGGHSFDFKESLRIGAIVCSLQNNTSSRGTLLRDCRPLELARKGCCPLREKLAAARRPTTTFNTTIQATVTPALTDLDNINPPPCIPIRISIRLIQIYPQGRGPIREAI